MKLLFHLLLLAVVSRLLNACQLFKKNDPSPLEHLPPANQERKNTIGFLLNGQPWAPKGYNGTSNYVVTYDPTYHGGSFDIRMYQLSDEKEEFFYIYSDSVNAERTYSLVDSRKGASTFRDLKNNAYMAEIALCIARAI